MYAIVTAARRLSVNTRLIHGQASVVGRICACHKAARNSRPVWEATASNT
jgi:hypothetical protein